MPLRFGVHIPTCIEGMMYPVPFARPHDILPVALLAERLGFDSVWGNDHMTTQRYVQRELARTAELLRAASSRSRTWPRARADPPGTGIIVLPMRTMPVLAKQVATLDQLSGGRVILGVGTGAYRRSTRRCTPTPGTRAGATSSTRACARCGCSSPSARPRFRGTHVRFQDVECFPKPRQAPLPMYAGGNHPRSGDAPASTARLDAGGALAEEIARGVEDVHRAAGQGRARRRRDRHRAAVRVLDRPHARGGGDALPRLAALQASRVSEAIHAA